MVDDERDGWDRWMDRVAEGLRYTVFGPDITEWDGLTDDDKDRWRDGAAMVIDAHDLLRRQVAG